MKTITTMKMTTSLIIVGSLLLVSLFLWTFRPKRISKESKQHVLHLIEKTNAIADLETRVLKADSVLHTAFKVTGSSGSLGDCLKQRGGELPNLNAVWTAHKLRNRIAHEPDVSFSTKEAESAARVLLTAAKSLL